MLKRAFTAFLAAAVCAAPRGYGFVFAGMGLAPSAEPIEVVEVTIPAEWGAVYENYNALQRRGGFDLEPYKGQNCLRYTYALPELNARGNVLVLGGKVIGGDICSITLDGIMLPLDRNEIKNERNSRLK